MSTEPWVVVLAAASTWPMYLLGSGGWRRGRKVRPARASARGWDGQHEVSRRDPPPTAFRHEGDWVLRLDAAYLRRRKVDRWDYLRYGRRRRRDPSWIDWM